MTENYPPDRGGMGESCDRITRGLCAAGVKVDVVHFDRRAARTHQRSTASGSVLRVAAEADAAHTINLLWNRMQRSLDLEATTHVVAFGGSLPMLAAPVLAAWMHRPLVTLLRGNELDAGLFDPRRRPVLDDALKRSAAVCTVTRDHAGKVSALHPDIDPQVIPNGIDLTLWKPAAADAQRAARWRGDHADGRRILGIFGHLKSKKGVPFFIESLIRSGAADRFHLLLAGDIDEPLRDLLAGRELHCTLLPAMDRLELIPYYLAADLIVIPSHYDGFPNVLIEAAALGRPLLASSTGGMRDLLTDGEHAFLFGPGDEQACAQAIAQAAAITDDTLRVMGARLEQLARDVCDARDETSRYLEVLRNVMEVTDETNDLRRGPRAAVHGLPGTR